METNGAKEASKGAEIDICYFHLAVSVMTIFGAADADAGAITAFYLT